MLGSCKRMTRRTIQVYSQSLAKAKKEKEGRIDRPSHILRKGMQQNICSKKESLSPTTKVLFEDYTTNIHLSSLSWPSGMDRCQMYFYF
jgi:hypothetical protein